MDWKCCYPNCVQLNSSQNWRCNKFPMCLGIRPGAGIPTGSFLLLEHQGVKNEPLITAAETMEFIMWPSSPDTGIKVRCLHFVGVEKEQATFVAGSIIETKLEKFIGGCLCNDGILKYKNAENLQCYSFPKESVPSFLLKVPY